MIRITTSNNIFTKYYIIYCNDIVYVCICSYTLYTYTLYTCIDITYICRRSYIVHMY